MPSIIVYPKPSGISSHINPLPSLLQTPSGLALLELQGSINTPSADQDASSIPIGNLVFPLYSSSNPSEDIAWMKRVYLYVGKNQRLTGEVKKLSKPIAIVRKRTKRLSDDQENADVMDVDEEQGLGDGETEVLEIAEVVRHKIVFSTRPEPVG